MMITSYRNEPYENSACGNPDATFKVNAVGRLVHVQKFTPAGVWDNSQVYFYDARGRTNKKWDQVNLPEANPATWGQYETKFGYDQADRVTTMTYPDNEVVSTGYNAAGQPNTLGGTSTYVSGAEYNKLGQPKQVNYGNGARDVYEYHTLDVSTNWWWSGTNAYGRLFRKQVYNASNSLLLETQYSYDKVGNVARRFTWNGTWEGNQYGYDDLDRLTSATPIQATPCGANPCAGGTGDNESYAYNAIGNMTSKAGVTLTYPCQNQVSCAGVVRPHAVTSTSNGGVFSYDGNGNMTSRRENGTGLTYVQTWNVDNKLSSVTATGVNASFSYDADGTRVKTVVNGTTTVYVGGYFEKNVTSGEVTKYYLFGGARVAMRKGATVSWLHSDHLGSASLATDGSGNKIANSEQRYTPFGTPRLSAGGLPSSFTYTGQKSFMDFGMMDYGARMYSPGLGRFLSPDSIVPRPNDPQSLNRFAYVRNNPVNRVDPTGHCDGVPGGSNCNPYDYAGDEGVARSLQNYAGVIKNEVIDGLIKAVEGFARIADKGWEYSRQNVDLFMWAMTNVLVGIDPRIKSPSLGGAQKVLGMNSDSPYFAGLNLLQANIVLDENVYPEASDWNSAYWDGTPNQAYHFWFYVAATYYDGENWARLGNTLHDPVTSAGNLYIFTCALCVFVTAPDIGQGGITQEDYNLGEAGIRMSQALQTSGTTFDPGLWIRTNLKQ